VDDPAESRSFDHCDWPLACSQVETRLTEPFGSARVNFNRFSQGLRGATAKLLFGYRFSQLTDGAYLADFERNFRNDCGR